MERRIGFVDAKVVSTEMCNLFLTNHARPLVPHLPLMENGGDQGALQFRGQSVGQDNWPLQGDLRGPAG